MIEPITGFLDHHYECPICDCGCCSYCSAQWEYLHPDSALSFWPEFYTPEYNRFILKRQRMSEVLSCDRCPPHVNDNHDRRKRNPHDKRSYKDTR